MQYHCTRTRRDRIDDDRRDSLPSAKTTHAEQGSWNEGFAEGEEKGKTKRKTSDAREASLTMSMNVHTKR